MTNALTRSLEPTTLEEATQLARAGLSRDELVDALAERVGALDAGESLTDYEMPVWRMDDDAVDSFAAMLGE